MHSFITVSRVVFLGFLLGSSSLLHPLKLLEEMMRPDGREGLNHADHVMLAMHTFSFTSRAQIKIGTGHTLVPVPMHSTLATIAGDTGVDFTFGRFFRCNLYATLENNVNLIKRAFHFSKRND